MKNTKFLNILGLNLTSIFRTLYGLIRGKLTAILLGVTSLGILGQILTVFTLQMRISSFGIDALLINRIGKIDRKKNIHEFNSLISNSLFYLLILNILFLVGTFFFVEKLTSLIFADPSYQTMMFFLLLLMPLYSSFFFLETLSQAKTDFKNLIAGKNISNFAAIISVLPLIFYFGEMGIVFSIYIYVITGGIYFTIINRSIFSGYSFKHLRDWRTFFPFFVRISFTDLTRKIIIVLSFMIFRIWIVKYLGMHENGLFQSVWSISYYPEIFIGSLGAYFYPMVSTAKANEIKDIISSNVQYLIYLIFPMISIVMIFPDYTLKILFDDKFLNMYSYLQLIMFFKFFDALYIFYTLAFLAQSKLKEFLLTEILRGIILSFFSLLMIRISGLEGAIFSIILMQISSLMLMLYFVRQDKRFHLSKETIKEYYKFTLLLLILLIPVDNITGFRLIKIFMFLIIVFILVDIKKYRIVFTTIFQKDR